MNQHKDQRRVQEVLLPALMDRVLSDDPGAVRDCIVVSRAFVQGPDPLFLMEACPDLFQWLCREVGLSTEDGRDAIERAHWQGPGVLLDGTGLPLESPHLDADFPRTWRREALWLVMASFSDCTEEGYKSDTSLLERLQRTAKAIATFQRTLLAYRYSGMRGSGSDVPTRSGLGDAIQAAQKFVETTPFTKDPKFGIPLTDFDHGFYVGYKLGFPAVAVKAGNSIFYGTTPSTNLAQQGITVDKVISPQFGIVFI